MLFGRIGKIAQIYIIELAFHLPVLNVVLLHGVHLIQDKVLGQI